MQTDWPLSPEHTCDKPLGTQHSTSVSPVNSNRYINYVSTRRFSPSTPSCGTLDEALIYCSERMITKKKG